MTFWAYLLHCNGGHFYAGHTDDLERRIGQHTTGAIPGFTRDFAPVTLVWSQEFPSRLEAVEAERRIKGWTRAKKLALIRGDWADVSRLAKKKDSPSTSSGRTVVLEEPSPAPSPVRAEPVEALPFSSEPQKFSVAARPQKEPQ